MIRGLTTRRGIQLGVLIALLGCGVAQSEQAKDQPTAELQGEPALVNNSFFNTDVRQALSDLAADTGVTILLDESVVGFISLDLKDVPLDRALKLMLLPLGMVYREIEPGVYLVTAADPKAPSFRLVAETQILPIGHLDPQNLTRLLPDRYAQFVRVDAAARRCLIEAPKEYLEDIVRLIRSLDTAPGQVLIEALVLETTTGALKQYAPTFASSHLAGDVAGGIFNYQSNTLNLGSTNTTTTSQRPTPGNLLVGLQWLMQNNQASLRANPRVVAPDGTAAEIEVGTQQYFSLLTGSAVYAYTRLERVDATIKLNIKPRVLPEGQGIECDIEPNVADVVGQGSDGLPVITVRRAKSTVRVQNGQGIVIGGLLQETSSSTVSKVPILGDLPVVGKLFRSKNTSKGQRDILFVISPHLLDENGQFEGPLLSEVLMSRKAPSSVSELQTPQKPVSAKQEAGAPRADLGQAFSVKAQ
jgi:type IV pilus assembly protein PilQ